MKNNKVLRVIVIMLLVIIMGFATIASLDNGSPLGNFLKKSETVVKIQRKYKNIMKEAMDINIAPLPKQ